MSNQYYGSSLSEEVSRQLFTSPAFYGDGILHTDDGWHFVTEDQDTYGPYETEQACEDAKVEYFKAL